MAARYAAAMLEAPERLELTPFTTPVTLEHLHLFAPSKNRRAERTMQKATKVYEVFSESLWLTIVVRANVFFSVC